MTKFEVGKKHPFGNELPADGSAIIVDGSGIILIVVEPRLMEREIEQFTELKEYGFYQCKSFPMGLIIWRFKDNWLIESYFNIMLEESLDDFMRGETNMLTRILIDENGIVRSLNVADLHPEFIKRIRRTWGDKTLDWTNYEGEYNKLCSKYKIPALWRKCYKYKHRDVASN